MGKNGIYTNKICTRFGEDADGMRVANVLQAAYHMFHA